jgi:hypothetical protein
MHMPAIVTIIISLPLDQILKVIVSHSAVRDIFDLIFVFPINKCQWWRRSR